MKIIYHPLYLEIYSTDPASKSGRIEAILKELEGRYAFLQPVPAAEQDIKRVHGAQHIGSIKKDPELYEISCLAAGGASMAAETALGGEPAFGLIGRPDIMPVPTTAGVSASLIISPWRWQSCGRKRKSRRR